MADEVELSRSGAHSEVALIKANAAELSAVDIATRTLDEGASFSKNDGAALLERDDTGKEAGE